MEPEIGVMIHTGTYEFPECEYRNKWYDCAHCKVLEDYGYEADCFDIMYSGNCPLGKLPIAVTTDSAEPE